MSEPIKVQVDTTTPSLTDTIYVDGRVQDLSGATVTFRMRAAESTTLKVDSSATVTSEDNGEVRYDWASSDTDTVGFYYGWWHVVFGSDVLETPEFPIIVDSHGPGAGVLTGAISLKVRQHIPIAYDALKNDSRYGEPLLQDRIDYVKYRLFSTVVSPTLEATSYNPLVLDYAAKLTTLQIIPAAVDYWTDQHQSYRTTGTNESVNFPDRINALWKVYDRVRFEALELKDEVEEWVITTRKRGTFPAVDTSASDLLSPDPKNFGRLYNPASQNLPTAPILPFYPWP